MKPASDPSETGYLSSAFGQAFEALGQVITLPDSGLQLLQRPIAGGQSDLLGLYPYSMCRDFAALTGATDQAALRATGAVALSFVADPMAGGVVQAALADWAVCRRFKTHFLIDLGTDWRARSSATIRRYVRRGYEALEVSTVTENLSDHAGAFWGLYGPAMERLGAEGLQAMSPRLIAGQLAVPGAFLTLTHARADGALVGAMLSYVQASHVSGHLIAFDARRADLRASYVLIDAAAAHAETLGCRWLNLGGPAGMEDDPQDGLYAFKSRWTPETRETLLCGQVLNPETYAALCADTGTQNAGFFPAYRAPGSALEWVPEL